MQIMKIFLFIRILQVLRDKKESLLDQDINHEKAWTSLDSCPRVTAAPCHYPPDTKVLFSGEFGENSHVRYEQLVYRFSNILISLDYSNSYY
jgi:hypothetical protein